MLLWDHSGGTDAGWRWAFLAVAVLAAIGVATTLLWAANSAAPQGRSLDIPGQITIAVALYAVIQGADNGWTSGPVKLWTRPGRVSG